MKLHSLEAVFRALNEAGVRYLVAGGVAVIAHGYVRFTQDLDLVIALDEPNAREAMKTLGRLGYQPRIPVKAEQFADAATRESWIREKQMLVFQLVSNAHPTVAIDVFVREPFDFEKEQRNAVRHELAPGVIVPVISLETLLRLKREANRPHDQQDIRMLTRQRSGTDLP
ncbi:MAG: hypothetical protein D6781_04340 [Verrucomicrobia bacterium]|nr:MAG: hypothetical protein D6781_04340 [Verrucomicrobiota bacterium]